jgi:hypothetical protein
MATKSRLNPNPASQPTLKSLHDGGILHREMIGLRNIIRATSGAVEPFGYDIGCVYDFIHKEASLSNFRKHARRAHGLVGYNGGRAEILAMTNYRDWHEVRDVLSADFPVNSLATSLLQQPCTKRARFDPKIPMYGDAVLITDRRYHWVFSKNQATEDEILAFDALLTTPRTLHKRWNHTSIVFHTEPNQADIFSIKMAWQ